MGLTEQLYNKSAMKDKPYFVILKSFCRENEWTEKFKIDEATLIDFATRFQDKLWVYFNANHPDCIKVQDEIESYFATVSDDRVDRLLREMSNHQANGQGTLQEQIDLLKKSGTMQIANEDVVIGLGKTKLLAYQATLEDDGDDWD
jgi:hypothetical protein